MKRTILAIASQRLHGVLECRVAQKVTATWGQHWRLAPGLCQGLQSASTVSARLASLLQLPQRLPVQLLQARGRTTFRLSNSFI